jgi:D-arginine dehydrogenase
VNADFIVIGAGIAGASVAYWLSFAARVVVLERESQPGYHSTGRSAALFAANLGPPSVRAMTLASRAFMERPPEGFAETPILSPRGALVTATAAQRSLLDQHFEIVREVSANARRLGAEESLALVPVLRPELLDGSVYDPDVTDMDVHTLHQGFLRGTKQRGGQIICDAEVAAIRRHRSDWEIEAGRQRYRAPVVIDAAGAWCDVVARMAGVPPLGLQPKRRTAFTFAPPAEHNIALWPRFGFVDGSFYVKPEAGLLLGSPANADPTSPHDVRPEEIDIAIAVDRIETYTTLKVNRLLRSWAGLRSFVADECLVIGYDEKVEGFFWLAGQGGYGIQTSVAAGEIAAALALGKALPGHIADTRLTAAMLGPGRLKKS